MAFIGPSGVGKTTLAQAVARAHFCPNSHLLGDCCGECKTCLSPDLGGYQEYSEWTGAELEEEWRWWVGDGKWALVRRGWLFFLDEGQDLSELHQKALLRRLEFTLARFILATTHKHKIVDALLNRFGANVYELRRPTLNETLTHLAQLCIKKKVQVTGEQLARVANHYVLDLRKCVDFVYTAKEQTVDGVVTDDFIDAVIGADSHASPATTTSPGGVEL